MPELVILVVNDPAKVTDVLTTWLDCGVPGATILDSSGLSHALCQRGEPSEWPLMPSLGRLMECREEPHRTLLAVVPDGFDLDRLAAATQRVLGRLDDPHTGIMFVLPVTRAWGLHRRRA